MIDGPEAITPRWLDEAIAPQGVSRRGEGGIESVNVREIGEGVGQLSRIFRVEIAGGEDYPASVVVKLPSDDPQAFRMCRRMSLYRREFLSYRRVTPVLEVATPNLLFGEFDVRTHRFVLVLDDVANWWDGQARGRDQLQGADASEAGRPSGRSPAFTHPSGVRRAGPPRMDRRRGSRKRHPSIHCRSSRTSFALSSDGLFSSYT